MRQPLFLPAVRVDERKEVCEEGVPFRVSRLVLVQGVPGLLRHPKRQGQVAILLALKLRRLGLASFSLRFFYSH